MLRIIGQSGRNQNSYVHKSVCGFIVRPEMIRIIDNQAESKIPIFTKRVWGLILKPKGLKLRLKLSNQNLCSKRIKRHQGYTVCTVGAYSKCVLCKRKGPI